MQLCDGRTRSAGERPPRRLAGPAVVDAGPGEEIAVELTVAARVLAHCDAAAHGWSTESGAFRLTAGRSSRDLRRSAELVVR